MATGDLSRVRCYGTTAVPRSPEDARTNLRKISRALRLRQVPVIGPRGSALPASARISAPRPRRSPEITMKKHLERVHSRELGRGVSLWSYGHWGPPVVVFPTAAGFAHEWEAQGMVEALAPWL